MTTEDQLVNAVKEQAKKLGGAWRFDHGIMPVVVLTTEEAAAVLQRIEDKPLALKYEYKGETLVIDPDQVTYIFSTDGI